jgi:hypothetical protein
MLGAKVLELVDRLAALVINAAVELIVFAVLCLQRHGWLKLLIS